MSNSRLGLQPRVGIRIHIGFKLRTRARSLALTLSYPSPSLSPNTSPGLNPAPSPDRALVLAQVVLREWLNIIHGIEIIKIDDTIRW